MAGRPIDTREMTAIHETLRKEFASLPLLVTSVGEADVDRAAVVGGHVMMMCMILGSHHEAEDALLWPLLEIRATRDADLVGTMEAQHRRIHELVSEVTPQTSAWMASADIANRSALHTSLIAVERAMLEHLSLEEAEVIPLVEEFVTQEEFNAIGEKARAELDMSQLAIGLGMILEDNSAEIGEVVLSNMPPEARDGFERFGRPAYRDYRARLLSESADPEKSGG